MRNHLIFGAAYYDEYTPASAGPDRLMRDIEMMQDAGFTTIRIAESTWGTMEPQPGVFDFTHVDRAIDAAARGGLDVIVGTPTYAVPTWMASRHPEVIAVTADGPGKYGTRQNMNIVSPTYRYYAERTIRALVEHTAKRENVVGFQLDNETKYHDTSGPDVLRGFTQYLREQFHDDLESLNAAFGLNYWSNRINAWEDVPDVTGTINGSFAAAFDRYRRGLVVEFLQWQRNIVDEYRRDDQFVTQNFDYDWRGYSYGIQPSVDHFAAANTVTLAGVDIYHPTEDALTGKEIGFGGDINRSIKDGANYLVVETQAQGQPGWLPYPGQLRLQGYSHLATGALGVMYWHWGSIHNSFETYWKGLLSQDYSPNPTYREACVFGRELREHADSLMGLTKHNHAAIMVSNDSYTALEWFSIEAGFPRKYFGGGLNYNDIFRWVYDATFDLNLEVDIVPADAPLERLQQYEMLIAPALYVTPQTTVDTLAEYVRHGGHLVTTFRTGVSDENIQIWADRQPHGLTPLLGLGTDQFTRPTDVRIATEGALAEALDDDVDLEVHSYLELLTPMEHAEGNAEVEVLARYAHHAWDGPAIARRQVGKGSITHVATLTADEVLRAVLRLVATDAGITTWAQDLADHVAVRTGTNARGNELTYLLNYSAQAAELKLATAGTDVLGITADAGSRLSLGQDVTIPPWGVLIIEGN